jgi:hypothetical protein
MMATTPGRKSSSFFISSLLTPQSPNRGRNESSSPQIAQNISELAFKVANVAILTPQAKR